jgi:hypothetical protein
MDLPRNTRAAVYRRLLMARGMGCAPRSSQSERQRRFYPIDLNILETFFAQKHSFSRTLSA